MHFARVIGTVVCTEKVPAWKGQRLLLVQPCDSAGKPSAAAKRNDSTTAA